MTGLNTTKKQIEYKVSSKIGTLSQYEKDGVIYSKELRIVSWNGKDEKYDLRTWYDDKDGNERMTKGITLNEDEMKNLISILNK